MSRIKRFLRKLNLTLKTNLSLTFLLLAIFFAGWTVGMAGFEWNLRLNPPSLTIKDRTPATTIIDASLLWNVLERIDKSFLFKPLNAQKLLYGAINGLIEALDDPYTSFLTPEENAEFKKNLAGTYEGIGAELGMREGQLVVVAPLEGSPAEAVGVKAGDKILEIEGVSTVGITISEAVAKIRGKAGTVSTLTLQRGKGKSFGVKITRAEITVKSVRYEEKEAGIFYIRVSRFGEGTTQEWDDAVQAISSKGEAIRGIVLDLRSNPGGLLSGAVYLASEFISEGAIVIEEGGDGLRLVLRVISTKNGYAFSGVPVVVLVDEGSASASEILAAALRERVKAKLVGEQTFGKGTVQDADDLSGGAGLHLTVAKWLTPSGKWIEGTGLKPDFEVSLTDEDIAAGRDPQLDRALELLRLK